MVSSNYFSWWCWRKMEIVATRDLWILVQIIRVTWWEFDTRNGNAAECYLPCSFCCNGVLDSVVWMLRFLNMISCQAFGGPSFFIRSQSLFGLFPAYPKKKKLKQQDFQKLRTYWKVYLAKYYVPVVYILVSSSSNLLVSFILDFFSAPSRS